MVEVPAIRSVAILVRVHVGPDLDTTQAQFTHTALQLARRKIDILQRDCAESRKLRWVLANDFGDMIV